MPKYNPGCGYKRGPACLPASLAFSSLREASEASPELQRGKQTGFTLIELMVVIAVIAILALVGIVIFTSVTGKARDARRQVDIQSISKAYEVQYSALGGYPLLTDSFFASGKKPTPPEGNNYYNYRASDGSAYRACAALEDNPQRTCSSPSQNCYCVSSAQGTLLSGGSTGLPPDSDPSCDPNGTLTSGLIAYWKLDEGINTFAYDSSGNNITGNITSASWITGKNNGALRFDGDNDQVDMGDPALLDFSAGKDFTIVLWAYVSSFSNADLDPDQKLVSKRSHLGAPTGYGVGIDNSGRRIAFQVADGDGALPDNFAVYSNLIPIRTWTHIAAVFDDDNQDNTTLYINAQHNQDEIKGTFAAVDDMTNSESFKLGAQGNGNLDLNGQLDDIRIYNRALSPGEIEDLYNGSSGCPAL